MRVSGALLLVLLCLCRPGLAAELDVPSGIEVLAGETVMLPLRFRHGQGPRIEVRLGVAPSGARLSLQETGELQLEWPTGPDLAEETRIELLVRDVDSGDYLDSVFAVVRRREPGPAPGSGPSAGPTSGPASGSPSASGPGKEAPADPGSDSAELALSREPVPLQTPMLPMLPNQVVSAGHTVRLQVVAQLDGPGSAVLLIDRLPRRASFEANAAGGRTFYWETSVRDQGEHLFRFSAFNSRDPGLRMSREVLVIVGDPSVNATGPDGALAGSRTSGSVPSGQPARSTSRPPSADEVQGPPD